MRFSSLFIAAILLVSATLFAQSKSDTSKTSSVSSSSTNKSSSSANSQNSKVSASHVASKDFKRPVPRVNKPSPASCPPGQSINGKGVCGVPPIVTRPCRLDEIGTRSNCRCPQGTSWNGQNCRVVSLEDSCASVILAAEELRTTQEQMQLACSNNSSEQECNDLKQRYEEARHSYESALRGSPMSCQAELPDPRSLGLDVRGNPSPHKQDKNPVPPK